MQLSMNLPLSRQRRLSQPPSQRHNRKIRRLGPQLPLRAPPRMEGGRTLIASLLRYIFGGQLSRMSTILAHHPNWAVSCARFSAWTTSRTVRTSTFGRARMARTEDMHSVVGISPAAETILQSQSSHEDAHFTFTFRKADGQPWRPWGAAPSAKRARTDPNPPPTSTTLTVGHTVQQYATPAPTPYAYLYPGYAPAYPMPYSAYGPCPAAPSPTYSSPGRSVMPGAPPPPAISATAPSQYPAYPPPPQYPPPVSPTRSGDPWAQ